jgi:hypothetical protein
MKYIYLSLIAVLTYLFIDTANAEMVCKDVPETKACATCCPKAKTKVVTKVVTKEVIVTVPVEKTIIVTKRIVRKNNLTLLAGIGPKGNLREEYVPHGHEVYTDNGLVAALQYSRNLIDFGRTSLTGSIQIQTNRTGLLGVGLDF